ncbi:MAG: PAS domain S-box protein, partial [Candidatus Acidiferrales bacterium]
HRGHAVQFYKEDGILLDALSRFIGTALGAGDAAIVIATQEHREGLVQRLKARGLDTAKAVKQGRYIPLDAAETLSKLIVDGLPDKVLFADLIGGLVARAKAAAEGEQPPIAIFGEMVALLWADCKVEAAIRLEQLWNDLARTYSFSLCCAYPMSGFYREQHGEPFLRICAEHSAVIPSESYTSLAGEEQRLRNIAQLQQKAQAFEAEMELRQSEERFRLLTDAVQDYAIFMLDPEGRISSWNSGAQRIKGYETSEIIGKHFSCFYPEEDVRFGKPQRELEIAGREGRVEDDGWRIRKDGSRFWANVIITALRDGAGQLVGFSKVTRDVTERMLAQEALQEAQQKLRGSENSLRQLSLHLLRTQDEERRRIGRDLHDSLGQYLSVLKIKLDSLRSLRKRKEEEANQELAECAKLAEESIKEVRAISYLLYPPLLEEMGLKSAISWYLDGFEKRTGIKATFETPPDFGRLPRDVEMAIFRVLQESLTNVHRHSGSPTADVRVMIKDSAVVLEVHDQGKGMPAGHLQECGRDLLGAVGVGLRGMSERMRQLGGSLELSSSPTGTTVIATVPVELSSSAAAQVPSPKFQAS